MGTWKTHTKSQKIQKHLSSQITKRNVITEGLFYQIIKDQTTMTPDIAKSGARSSDGNRNWQDRTFMQSSQQSSSKETFCVCRLCEEDRWRRSATGPSKPCVQTDDSGKPQSLNQRVMTPTCTCVLMCGPRAPAKPGEQFSHHSELKVRNWPVDWSVDEINSLLALFFSPITCILAIPLLSWARKSPLLS